MKSGVWKEPLKESIRLKGFEVNRGVGTYTIDCFSKVMGRHREEERRRGNVQK